MLTKQCNFHRIYMKTTKAIDIVTVHIVVNQVTTGTTQDGALWMVTTKVQLISKKNPRHF